MFFLPERLEKLTFSETLAGISTLTKWTPCVRLGCAMLVLLFHLKF